MVLIGYNVTDCIGNIIRCENGDIQSTALYDLSDVCIKKFLMSQSVDT